MNRSKRFKKRLRALTERRRQVAIFAAHGLSNRAIAEVTVKNHLHKIYRKLNVHHKIDLVIHRPKKARLAALTDGQRQVAAMACRGLSNREIARSLGVVEGTVKIHLHEAYKKLDVHSRNALANALAA